MSCGAQRVREPTWGMPPRHAPATELHACCRSGSIPMPRPAAQRRTCTDQPQLVAGEAQHDPARGACKERHRHLHRRGQWNSDPHRSLFVSLAPRHAAAPGWASRCRKHSGAPALTSELAGQDLPSRCTPGGHSMPTGSAECTGGCRTGGPAALQIEAGGGPGRTQGEPTSKRNGAPLPAALHAGSSQTA